MREYHESLAKYWATTSRGHHAGGFHHLGALYERYSNEHQALSLTYKD